MRKEEVEISIRGARLLKGYTQQQLADAIGVKQESISQWETGKYIPNMRQLALMAKELDCSLDDLIYSNDSEK